MKTTLSSCAVALAILSPMAFAAEQTKQCQVSFSFDSAKVDSKALEICAEVLKLKAGDKVTVDGYASAEGPAAHNMKLSQNRAKAVAAVLNRKVQGLELKAEGHGVRETEGRVVVLTGADKDVVVVAAAPAEKIPGTKVAALGTSDAVSIKSAPASSTKGRWRAAVRSGFDTTRIESREEYFAPGLDLAYLPDFGQPNLRVEIGALASLYAEGNENRLGSYHFAPMVGYQNSGYVAGIRGLAGNVHSNQSDKDFTDTGAELRLGVERDQWSLFVGGGRTSTLDRVGMDFGLRF